MSDSIYFYYGNNDFLVNKEIDSLIEKLNVDPINIIKYDLIESEQQHVLEEIQTVSFFSDQKVVVVKNVHLLNNEVEHVIETWANYISNPKEDIILILQDQELLAESSILGKAIFLNSVIKKIDAIEEKEYPNYILSILKKYQYEIDNEAINELLERTSFDFYLISQEIDKLMLFCYDTKIITHKDITLLVSRNLEENIYELTNAVVSRNINKAIEVFYDLMARNEEPIRILNQLANKFRELLHVKLLIDKGYTQDQVSKHFNMAPGKTYYVIKSARQISFSVLEDYIKRLGKLDHEIKSGQADKKLGLEMFLLGV